MASVKDQIREFVLENARSKGINEVSDDQSLMVSGIIDSLAIFRLVAFLEDSFRVRIGDDEIVPENFQSVNDIESFVSGKLAGKGEAASTR
ncbi:MAG TPA: acyl carrier protein [Terriglobales bacterium]|nr:acyl carrier protein [Terriglobales bacterium]